MSLRLMRKVQEQQASLGEASRADEGAAGEEGGGDAPEAEEEEEEEEAPVKPVNSFGLLWSEPVRGFTLSRRPPSSLVLCERR